ncbi:RabGAP/TBC [Cordyceps fumosorosea ARSEF 2679]|uniref:RabGAP/TBC n=1 Tax=Cordyceps fumosorosea (strain ARSEF 2679) TaxID=1081104 RepID=A0A167UB30_CORFA|nr:RabGAP/TBC [Cordyceps fumosorosea ARSEF 2679]OAA61403.1 RabGAP/TBC [Cordyceps fumosorosea ARSEF 2679]
MAVAVAVTKEPASDHNNTHVERNNLRKSIDSADSVQIPSLAAMTEEDADAQTPKMTHDSMVTVRLSEPPSLTLDTSSASDSSPASSPVVSPKSSEPEMRKGSNKHISTETSDVDNGDNPRESVVVVRHSTAALPRADAARSLQDELGQCDENTSDTSEDREEVNWEELEKTEDQQTKDDETDNSTALLLARLEQENAKLATNPKTVKVQAVEKLIAAKTRPPSMAQLRQMISSPAPPELRYSMLPPPPMTDLEFYAALVKDYQQTAARLPTLLSNKIRKGIPPPLRGVVWVSMSGARDAQLEEQFDRFSGESSPYELLIGKDLGRSFPGVDMFRDPEGDGQRMLGNVLKAFSLYDTKIGYCQGLAFLVGPLLMHMPDKQAFCVLVRLMERYDLRACFLPDLSGLHVRIYQFRELLRNNFPALSAHLEELQVETAYVSQWFLSFFAVTSPLPMLFRIYDVIFAEGASETLMRVALSLMRKNESRLLACSELEDVMQLLLSRGLWDCYHYDADEFVQDFASLTAIVTREKLAQLEQAYRESLIATANAARTSDITTAASRFLGRIWANSNLKTATLAPGLSAPGKQFNILRRSTSKQSLASTLNSVEASSASVSSSTSTDGTSLSRDSANPEDVSSSRESTPVGPKAAASSKTTEDRYLHSQIEDLLTALTELQRSNALVTNQLQREREERDEDRRAVRSLLDGLRRRAGNSEPEDAEAMPRSLRDSAIAEDIEDDENEEHDAAEESDDTATADGKSVKDEASVNDVEEDDAAMPMADEEQRPSGHEETLAALEEPAGPPSTEDLSVLLDRVETRFAAESNSMKHRSSMLLTKSQLREELSQAKSELNAVTAQCQDLNRRVYDMDQEMAATKDQLKDRHSHVRTLHLEKQKLEKQLHSLRTTRASASPSYDTGTKDADMDWAAAKGVNGAGLREFKLGRSRSTPSTQGSLHNKRISSLPQPSEILNESPPSEHEALLLELVQAKTAEATAKQEAEEAKQKLEALRKATGLAPGDSPSASSVAAGAMGMFGRLTGQAPAAAPTTEAPGKPTPSTSASSAVGGGFWGWRR